MQDHSNFVDFVSPTASTAPMVASECHEIVIVGGGVGGIELATRLGDVLGKRGRARITLVDKARTHLWKPLLHVVAPGSMDPRSLSETIWRKPIVIISTIDSVR